MYINLCILSRKSTTDSPLLSFDSVVRPGRPQLAEGSRGLPIESRTLRTIFSGANRAETQPISFVTGKEAPSLLITARRDRLVSPGNSRRMAAKIRDHGGVAEELIYGGVGHLTLIGAFAPGLRVLAPVLRDATQFVWRVTRRQAHLVAPKKEPV